jgi:hypothetical protein
MMASWSRENDGFHQIDVRGCCSAVVGKPDIYARESGFAEIVVDLLAEVPIHEQAGRVDRVPVNRLEEMTNLSPDSPPVRTS